MDIDRELIIDKYSKIFLVTLGVIISLGIIMVYSSSYIYAKDLYHDSAFFLKKQLFFLFVGSFLAYIISRTKLDFWIKNAFYFNLFVAILLILTFVPGLSVMVKGANRWISINGLMNFQPGELAKLSTLFAAIYFFKNYQAMKPGRIALHVLVLILPLVLVISQPDYGTFLICLCGVLFICFMSSFPRAFFYSITAGGIGLVALTLFVQPYRVKRVLSFLDPWKNAKTSGFQVIQSYLAFANGSFWGTGLGNSKEKLFYLPEAHNDFIFSVVGEELGFIGIFIVILLFALLVYWGLKLAVLSENHTSVMVITGLVFLLGLQVVINMGVVMGLLPTKGLNLPFVSSGGSSLLANLVAVGFIYSAIRHALVCQGR